MQKILLIDNYDSFTYNLLHLMRSVTNTTIDIVRNDKIALQEIAPYEKILISPGPGIPAEAGIVKELIAAYAPEKSILGICLGHQAIGEVFGAQLLNLESVCHGIKSTVYVRSKEEQLFEGIPAQFDAGRYHSWAVAAEGLPDELQVTAETDDPCIMAMSHRHYDVKGLQFHPESILTQYGKEMMRNWINNH